MVVVVGLLIVGFLLTMVELLEKELVVVVLVDYWLVVLVVLPLVAQLLVWVCSRSPSILGRVSLVVV